MIFPNIPLKSFRECWASKKLLRPRELRVFLKKNLPEWLKKRSQQKATGVAK
jgi:hypothetical protein